MMIFTAGIIITTIIERTGEGIPTGILCGKNSGG